MELNLFHVFPLRMCARELSLKKVYGIVCALSLLHIEHVSHSLLNWIWINFKYSTLRFIILSIKAIFMLYY